MGNPYDVIAKPYRRRTFSHREGQLSQTTLTSLAALAKFKDNVLAGQHTSMAA